ncbi:Na/Pi cotransporter family protein [Bacillus infantis]|uniref:Na/Pi symporter n=1 Tax=Bacillus infantis TaxID=324767 RepID=UPI00101B93B3|nr:Na/Pi symporter [Bacillus infantis]RYI31503.1 Na/Pi cotransporter family protein [Bacillus infantis]
MLLIILFLFLIIFFIYGMALLRSGLYGLSGDSFKRKIAAYTHFPWQGMLAGMLITAVLQSSSAVMVLTIGLISARILTFPQSIGIILGTNIGTTFTTEFITFNIESLIIPLAAAGSCLILFGRKALKHIGMGILGISIVLSSMKGFEFLASPLQGVPFLTDILGLMENSHLTGAAVGMVLTAIIQSSTAAVGIIMGFLNGGIIELDTGIAFMLGANIGTCLTAYLASIGAGKEARLTAFAHIWLNIAGAVLFLPFIASLSSFGEWAAAEPDVQLAHVSVLFNVLTSLMVLPFAEHFGRLIMKIHDK